MKTLADMSFQHAERLFKAYGGTVTDDPEKLKLQYLALAKWNHPDAGGSHRAMADINAAYASLAREIGHAAPPRPGVLGEPDNANDFVRKVKEISGAAARPMRVWAFDGERSFFSMRIEAAPAAYDAIAKGAEKLALASEQRLRARAVLVSAPDSQQMLCIWADGKMVSPVAFSLFGFVMNPAADKRFVTQLKQYLR